jgi:phosphoglucomutase
MDAKARYEAWLTDPLIDADTKAELLDLAQDWSAVEDRFYKWLEFGTGGLRGTIGAGTNRMNIYTVRLATQALALSLKEKGAQGEGVVIACDSRRMSREFAQAAAGVLVANGFPVHLFPDIAPTPLLSFAVRFLKASAGIVITASHNPPQYNGYKVYNEAGCQILSSEADAIAAWMARLGLEEVKFDPNPDENPLFSWVGAEVVEAYYESVLAAVPKLTHSGKLRVLYTPLHGTGGRHVPEILRRAGFRQVAVVPEQFEPNGEFPTVRFPNPEDPAAFELAFSQGEKEESDLIIATDPDADRMGAAVRHGDRWILLNGNQMGVLLADFLLSRWDEERLKNGVLIKTIVTTEMIEPLARKFGVEVRNTLTGFKYIGALMDELPGEDRRFLFGFEESYGYLVGTHVRDKDAVVASLLTAQAAAFYADRGLSLVERLEQLCAEHGHYLQELVSYSFANSLEAERARLLVERLRQDSPTVLGTQRVRELRDYGRGTAISLDTGETEPINLPREEVLQWLTEEGGKASLRPSGTEPKMKLYLEARGATRSEAESRLAELKAACQELIARGLAGH